MDGLRDSDTPPPGTLLQTSRTPRAAPHLRPGSPRWLRPLLGVLTALALLVTGASIGALLLGPSRVDRTVPDADSVDVGFLQDMSTHHEQAVTMASWERDHTVDPALAQLSTDIEATQNGQLGRMQGWLEMWGAAAFPLGSSHMGWMQGSTHGHAGPDAVNGPVARMPGMASSEDLARQKTTIGTAGDVLFLQLMLRHHEGGRTMLDYAAQYAETPQVRNLAARMLSSQDAESALMRGMLAERGAAALPLS